MDEDYTDEQLYQGVEIRPGVFLTKKRPRPPPRILTGLSDGIHPYPNDRLNYLRSLAEDDLGNRDLDDGC